RKLNDTLQNLLNPDGDRIERNPFRIGDKVICLKNGFRMEHFNPADGKPDVITEMYAANGEIGKVIQISEHWISVKFIGKEQEIRFDRSEWSEVDLAYAITVHKAQGAGFPVVVV